MQTPSPSPRTPPRRRAIGLVWLQFGPYHADRCEAVGRALGAAFDVHGIEVGSFSDTYAWDETEEGKHFRRLTLFPGENAEHLSQWRIGWRLARAIRRLGLTHLFIAGYELPGLFAAAVAARMLGVRVFVSLDSKFDDKPRRLSRELLKRVLMLPYHGGLVAGRRSAEYLRFLGFRRRPIASGYDSVALDRVRRLAPAPTTPWEQRPFVIVARLVPKKNLGMALTAYARFLALEQGTERRLRICGSGPLEGQLRQQAAELGIGNFVDFLGHQPQEGVARELAGALCLVLPSSEEQWGLVVNEALAFSLPVLVSENAGARDALAGNLSNGFVLDPDDADAWAEAMRMVATDRSLHARMTRESARRAARADVGAFIEGVGQLVGPA